MKALITVTGDANGAVVTPFVSKKYIGNGYLSLVELAADGLDTFLIGDMVNFRLGDVGLASGETMLVVTMRYKWQRHGLVSSVPMETVCHRGWIGSIWSWLWSL